MCIPHGLCYFLSVCILTLTEYNLWEMDPIFCVRAGITAVPYFASETVV